MSIAGREGRQWLCHVWVSPEPRCTVRSTLPLLRYSGVERESPEMGSPNYERERRRSYWVASQLRTMDFQDKKGRVRLLVFMHQDPRSARIARLHEDPLAIDLRTFELLDFNGDLTERGHAVARVLKRTVSRERL